MHPAFRYLGWPLLAGILLALLLIQSFPQWVGLPGHDVQVRHSSRNAQVQRGPVSYADAVNRAAPAVANL